MKNTSLAALIFIWALAGACQKEDQHLSDKNKVPVTFAVSGFNNFRKEISYRTSDASSMGASINNISCYVHDVSSGALVETLDQTKGNVNFGTLTLDLPPGTYIASIVASGGNIEWGWANFFNQAYFHTFSSVPHDTFFKRLDSIRVAGTPISNDVTLKRIVSGLEVTLEDAIPASVSKIVLTVENEALNFKISEQEAKGYFTRSYSFSVPPSDIETPNRSFATYVLPNTIGYKMNVKIKALNASGQTIAEKVVPDVIFEVNKKSILKGKLFNSSASGTSFTITIDTNWDGTLPTIFF